MHGKDDETAKELAQLRSENARLTKTLNGMLGFFKGLEETSSQLFWRTDEEHRFCHLSRASGMITGEPIYKLLGQTRMQVAHGSIDTPAWRRHLSDLDARRPFYDFRYVRLSEDGVPRHLSISGVPQYAADGRFIGYVGVAADITNQIEGAAKIEASEQLLMRAIDVWDSMITVWDSNDRLVVYNQRFRREHFSVAEFIRKGITFEEHLRGIFKKQQLAVASASEAWIEWRLEQHRNPRGPFEVARANGVTFLVNEARLPDGSTIIVSSDITAQKKTEMALRESEQRLRDFGDVAADWFWEMDADLRFSYFSGHFPGGTFHPATEFIGKTRRETKPNVASEADLLAHEDDLNNRRPFSDFRHYRYRADGSKAYLSIDGKPYFAPDGTFLGYRGVGRDITDLIKVQEQLRHEKDRAEQASLAKSQFLAHMSHELRTPLNAILGFSEIISGELFGPIGSQSYLEYASDIHRSGQLLLSLINDLLDLSKIEAGKVEIVDEPLSIKELLQQTGRFFQQRLANRKIKFEIAVAEDGDGLLADRRAVSQILFNLISNAEKFNRDGGRVDVSVYRDAEGCPCISVRDTGYGFDSSDLEKATAPFGRIENAMTKSTQGTGLGLPIVVSLMALHGGRLEIDSALDRGTEAIVIFPADRAISPG